MSTTYTADHTDALTAVADAGAPVAFTLAGQGAYDPATDTTAPGDDVVITGSAIEKKGSLIRYQALGLVIAKARTLFFVPTTLGDLPPLSAIVVWGGVSYVVKDVQPIAPNGDAIAATVVIAV